MAKPRIIIADIDENYISPLQLRFAEEYYESINLEIITDTEFFEELFSIPQTIDILIVSEDFYNTSLFRHNISNIFLMTEKYEDGEVDQPNTTRIFKYTSIKEIFNEISGKCSSLSNNDTFVKKDPQIVLIYSGCGGVGKTTIALGMSVCLTQNYKRVLYINAGCLQSFQNFLENKSPISDSSIYSQLSNSTISIKYESISHLIRKEVFSYLPPFKAPIMSLGIPFTVYKEMALAAKKSGDYDYILIDLDTEFNEDRAELLNIADKVLIITRQDSAAINSTNILVSNINGINSEKYIFVCNNFSSCENNAIISPTIDLKFIVDEYIEHIPNFDNMSIPSIAQIDGIQKTSFLII